MVQWLAVLRHSNRVSSSGLSVWKNMPEWVFFSYSDFLPKSKHMQTGFRFIWDFRSTVGVNMSVRVVCVCWPCGAPLYFTKREQIRKTKQSQSETNETIPQHSKSQTKREIAYKTAKVIMKEKHNLALTLKAMWPMGLQAITRNSWKGYVFVL